MSKGVIIALIIFVIAAFLVLNKFDPNKKINMNKSGSYNEDDAFIGIKNVERMFGTDMARIVERMARLETNHFKSSQYALTGTAGMEKGAWGKIVPVTDTVKLKDPVLGYRDYLVWNPNEFFVFLANYIKRYNGNFARWNSTDPTRQAEYTKRVNSIKNKFV